MVIGVGAGADVKKIPDRIHRGLRSGIDFRFYNKKESVYLIVLHHQVVEVGFLLRDLVDPTLGIRRFLQESAESLIEVRACTFVR